MSQTNIALPRGVEGISEVFRKRKESGGKILVPYIMAGDPDLGTTEKIVRALSGIDIDIIELGIPFSDPLADGPVIQRAGQRSIRQGTTLKKVLNSVETIRLDVDTPIIFMTYYNLFLRYGLDRFVEDAARVGVDGVIVPDLPPEEAEEFKHALDAKGLAFVYLIAPTSNDERIRLITGVARGFVYYVSRTGVTGEQSDIASDLEANLERIRSITDLPTVVGFGISNPEQALSIAHHADGIVIGSANVRLIEETRELHERAISKFLRPYVEALHHFKN